MRLYFILSLIPCFYYLIYKSKKAMHMLQQNWYNDDNRYFKWVIENEEKVFITFDMLFMLFLLFQFIKVETAIFLFTSYYLIVYYLYKKQIKKEQSKKPLVITARIKRLYATLLLLYLIIILPMIFFFNVNSIHILKHIFLKLCFIMFIWEKLIKVKIH